MSTKKHIVEPPERLERRKPIYELLTKIEALELDELDASLLKSLNIDVQRMSLDISSNCAPHFFASGPSLAEPDDEDLEEHYEALNCEETCGKRPVDRAYQIEGSLSTYTVKWLRDMRDDEFLWTQKCAGHYNAYTDLYQYRQPEFGIFRLMVIPGREFPHIKAVMYNNMLGDDQTIVRGELLTILRLMWAQLKKGQFIKHMMAPVFLISLMGKRGRVIEGYHDGKQLILRPTLFSKLPEETLKAYKAWVEWYLGDPAGVTS